MGAAVAATVVLAGVNVVRAATVSTPERIDSETVATLLPDVLAAVGDAEGQVLVADPFGAGMWWARGLVLQLERRRIDARVPANRALHLGEHRVVDEDQPVAARLLVATGDTIDTLADGGARVLAEWTAARPTSAASARTAARRAEIESAHRAGRLTTDQALARLAELDGLTPGPDTVGDMAATRVAVLLQPRPLGHPLDDLRHERPAVEDHLATDT